MSFIFGLARPGSMESWWGRNLKATSSIYSKSGPLASNSKSDHQASVWPLPMIVSLPPEPENAMLRQLNWETSLLYVPGTANSQVRFSTLKWSWLCPYPLSHNPSNARGHQYVSFQFRLHSLNFLYHPSGDLELLTVLITTVYHLLLVWSSEQALFFYHLIIAN